MVTADNPTPKPSEILSLWFGDGLELGWPSTSKSDLWWGGGPALDLSIKTQFGTGVQQAVAGGLQDWEDAPLNRLALVILLDQFSRNVYRGSAQAFAGDGRAQRLVMDGLALKMDGQLPWCGRAFFYMPLMHCEDLAYQDECVKRFGQLHQDGPEAHKAELLSNLKFARDHRDIIARFGRFPYRNAVLGRTNTALEDDFIKTGPRFGQ